MKISKLDKVVYYISIVFTLGVAWVIKVIIEKAIVDSNKH